MVRAMRRPALVLAVLLSACGAPEEEQPAVTIAQYRSGLTMSGAGGCDTGIAAGLPTRASTGGSGLFSS
jgi:hypothetical protein